MSVTRHISAVIIACIVWMMPSAARTENSGGGSPLTYQILYTGDWMHALAGGIKAGSGYLGMANLCLGLDMNKAGLTHAGSIFMKASYTHGATPSAALIGDFQVASNIEAGTHTYIQELWYRQPIGPLELFIGLQDMNVHFVSNVHSGAYLNSSFGVPSSISHNIPAPIFPLTSPGIMLSWAASDRIVWQAAVYDGSPGNFGTNPHNMKWHFGAEEGALAITELQYSLSLSGGLEGLYKVGIYDHTHLAVRDEASASYATLYRDHYGIYMTADQMLAGAMGAQGGVALFARAGFSPKHTSPNSAFYGAGIDLYGAFSGEGEDMLGLAFAHAAMAEGDSETALELTYHRHLTGCLSMQPDFQYIIHPAGAGAALDNAFVATIRFGLSF